MASHPAGATEEEEGEDGNSDTAERTNEALRHCSREAKAGDRRDDSAVMLWPGVTKKMPLLYSEQTPSMGSHPLFLRVLGEKYNMAFKMVSTECRLVRQLLAAHGFHEVHANSGGFSLMWIGSHVNRYLLRNFKEHQKINHFPRSYEVTRKDRLCKNVQRMQRAKGKKYFDFIPESYLLPTEFQDFSSAFIKDKCPWIVKPVASSRGRGISIVTHPDQAPLDDPMVVSRYIQNPLLIDGFKFDVRLYVGVTSYDPLVVYLYEEGLARFATVKYDETCRQYHNQCMHLTNYSLNKKSDRYVRCEDPDIEDFGNKWSMSAMLRYLKSQGHDTTKLMARIEDLIIKTLISAELPIATACKMYMPYRSNCFEIYGFDILIDDTFKPWVLEVNLSPSLACDTPLDLRVKSGMAADMFNLAGFGLHDPITSQKFQQARNSIINQPSANSTRPKPRTQQMPSQRRRHVVRSNLSPDERRVLRIVREEHHRRGGFVRIFPTPFTWEQYSSFLEFKTSYNRMLHEELFPDRVKPSSAVLGRNGNNVGVRKDVLDRVEQYVKKKTTDLACDLTPTYGVCPPAPGLQSLPACITSEKPAFELVASPHETRDSSDQSVSYVYSIEKNGAQLSKLQARRAFAAYLQCVGSKLQQESVPDNQAEAQITLVLRFLRKAIVNLEQPFLLVEPSNDLSVTERRLSLAVILANFVAVYAKETEKLIFLKNIGNLQGRGDYTPSQGISESEFNKFLKNSSENQLEDILTTYTKVNKSTSIFIGSVNGRHPSHLPRGVVAPLDARGYSSYPQSKNRPSPKSAGVQVAAVYSNKAVGPSERPQSTSSNNKSAGSHARAARARSARAYNEPSPPRGDDSLSDALKRLALR
ncbi:PREDICTED: LOW QUALITY PROTEIN: tubulin polyglutamylase TTLL5-like, partial [Priapulus caudatus]|uniref:Tubulin--tyrosine ligase-like protein 5 n=1 Tax=Priapulus caudatus TaxID=37621 RepID=A0ABM1EFT0_PRICU